MKKRNKIIIGVIALLFILIVTYNINSKKDLPTDVGDASEYGFIETNASTEEKLDDFEYLYGILEKNYPFFEVNKRLNDVDW